MILSELPIGVDAIITAIKFDDPNHLMEMGIITGCKVRKVYEAPFGGAAAFLICEYIIALDNYITNNIEVKEK